MASERGALFSPMMIMTDFESGVLPVVKPEVRDECFEIEFSSFFFTYSFLVSNFETFRLLFPLLSSDLS
jgi:hypothetical protein